MIFLNINQYKSVNFNQKHICDQKKAIYINFFVCKNIIKFR